MLILFVVFIVNQEIRSVFRKLKAQVGDVTIRNQNVIYPVVARYYRSKENCVQINLLYANTFYNTSYRLQKGYVFISYYSLTYYTTPSYF